MSPGTVDNLFKLEGAQSIKSSFQTYENICAPFAMFSSFILVQYVQHNDHQRNPTVHSIVSICRVHLLLLPPRARAPTYRHSLAASPCCTAVLPSSRSHTLRLVLQLISLVFCLYIGSQQGVVDLLSTMASTGQLSWQSPQ